MKGNILEERVMAKTTYQELFLFAAKAGSLEGYLYERTEVEPLANWVDNIGKMYQALSPEVKREVDPVLTPVLERILTHEARVLEPGLKDKLEQILLATRKVT
jgi:hypothetical protein